MEAMMNKRLMYKVGGDYSVGSLFSGLRRTVLQLLLHNSIDNFYPLMKIRMR
ncbi:hypothetical protein C7382_11340 [Porphyromonas loveana]|uniref:Uncharacterized protein n=1 Tax=Porphyromonas loveana TaxID=1884669 RepID=A0A2U1F863_9PORP|nr:hypothetical protein C7382_11340 [Porphyromonas loveana]